MRRPKYFPNIYMCIIIIIFFLLSLGIRKYFLDNLLQIAYAAMTLQRERRKKTLIINKHAGDMYRPLLFL